MELDEFLAKITDWAKDTNDIQLLALVGSQARGMARPDSDIDLIILTDQSEEYLLDTRWADAFGEIDRKQFEDYGKISSLRIFYKEGLEVEFGFGKNNWAGDPDDTGTLHVIQDGIWILFSRDPSILSHIENLRRDTTDSF